MTRSYLSPDEVNDRVFNNKPIAVEEVADHYDGTTFWNYTGTIEEGLADAHRDQPFALSLSQSSEPNEDGIIRRELRFDSGEITIDVATMYENIHADETCHEIDAAFVANLPAYMEALFREIYTLRKERGEAVAPAENDAGKTGLGRVKRYVQGLDPTNQVQLVLRFRKFEEEIRQELQAAVEIKVSAIKMETLETRLRHVKGMLLEIAQKVGIDVAGKVFEEKLARDEDVPLQVPGRPDAPTQTAARICNGLRGLSLSWVEVMYIVSAVEQCASGQPRPESSE